MTEDFPETFEFDIDGVHITAKIERVEKRLNFTSNHWGRPTYTASYQAENYDGQMHEVYATGVDYQITATYSCDKDILTVKYAKDAEGTYLFGEPQEESPVDNSITIKYDYRCDATKPDYLNGYFSGGEIYSDEHEVYFAETKDQASMGAPDGIYEFYSANISEEKVQEFFETYQYTAAQKDGYWDDISATMPKTMEFDYDGKHYVIEIKDLQMGISLLVYPAYFYDGPFYTAKVVGSEERYAAGVTFEIKGTYTCDSIDSSAE